MRAEKRRSITVKALARVEGEGALHVRFRGDTLSDVKLKIYEPPRFFEAFLTGRLYSEAPDITARICGICPIAYQMSSIHAMEQIFGVAVAGPLRDLRRLIYCGEWIESHALHIYMLHAPDFLGYESGIHMAADHAETVQRGLRLKKLGNSIVALLGGREIHPINVRVGGFYRTPRRVELRQLIDELEWAREAALQTVHWVAAFEFPEFERPYEYVALRHPDEYPLNEGRLVSSQGLDIPIDEFDANFSEDHVAHSNALQASRRGHGAYHVGPLARYSLNFDRLPAIAQDAAKQAGLGSECFNPFKSIVVRAVELVFACDEALQIIARYEEPDRPAVAFDVRAGTGHGCSEAPRGSLYHRYQLSSDGVIQSAQIVPPTAQNQKTIEDDLWQLVPQHMDLDHDALTWRCEQAIRNYDPCISCATHFLRLAVSREPA